MTLGNHLIMYFKDGVFTLSFTDKDVSGGRDTRRVKLSFISSIRILFDTSSIEIYLNDGERVMSTRFYPEDTETELKICDFTGKLYRLEGINILKGAENE